MDILKKIWDFLKQENRIFIVVAIILALIIYFQFKNTDKWKDKYEVEVKLKNALIDTVTYYQNENKEWVAEKLTIQESTKNLEKIFGQLSNSQKELINRVKEVEKTNEIINAALIETKVLVEKLVSNDSTDIEIDTVRKTIRFGDYSKIGNKELIYQLTIGKVVPAFSDIKPTLMIDSLYFPNKTFVEFHWEKNKKADYPVSFSVSNSNGYFKTVGVESYAIPDIKYEGSKFKQWLTKNGKALKYIGIGAGGATGLWLIMK
jgi:hypothetical protein